MLTVVLAASSCGYHAPPVRMYGDRGDIERLVGEWFGEYVGDIDHDRRGTISFKLAAADDQAHGDVVMTPAGAQYPFERYRNNDERPGRSAEDVERTRVLSIRFVRAEGRSVTGLLDPYWDPDRRTEASTVFSGRWIEDTIGGTFITSYASGAARTRGTWRVRRMR